AQPGHIFPLQAQPGGVLSRAGHTEAAADLALMAGLEPAGVLVEILNPDGTMARRPELEVFAREHGLKIGSIEDLIRYRLETEHTVERVDERDIQTGHGPFRLVTYRDRLSHGLHFALVRGEPDAATPALVRVQPLNLLADALHWQRADVGPAVGGVRERLAGEAGVAGGPHRPRRGARPDPRRAGGAAHRARQRAHRAAAQRRRRPDPLRPRVWAAAGARHAAQAGGPARFRP